MHVPPSIPEVLVPAGLKTLLLGGLDSPSGEPVRRALADPDLAFEVRSPANLRELRDCLTRGAGDLLILDLDEQQDTALEWLAAVSEFQAPLPVLTLGKDSGPDVQGYERRFPGRFFPLVRHLQKPVSAEAVAEAAFGECRQAAWGVIQGLSLPGLLQMLAMEQKTCTIRVASGRRSGFFYLREGQVINARYRRLEGLDAVRLMMGLAAPTMEIDSRLHDPTQRIDLRVEELLMSAAQLMDEGVPDTDAGTTAFQLGDSGTIPASEIGRWERTAASAPAPPPTKAPRGRWLLLSLPLLALVAGGIWLGRPRSATLEIRSRPDGASVSLDGLPKGTTPLNLQLASPAQGRLRLTHPGYQPVERVIHAEDRHLVLELQKETPPPATEPAPSEAAPEKPAVPRPKPRKPLEPPPAKRDIFDQLRKQPD